MYILRWYRCFICTLFDLNIIGSTVVVLYLMLQFHIFFSFQFLNKIRETWTRPTQQNYTMLYEKRPPKYNFCQYLYEFPQRLQVLQTIQCIVYICKFIPFNTHISSKPDIRGKIPNMVHFTEFLSIRTSSYFRLNYRHFQNYTASRKFPQSPSLCISQTMHRGILLQLSILAFYMMNKNAYFAIICNAKPFDFNAILMSRDTTQIYI